MIQRNRIGGDLCAVAFSANEIMVRKSGKQYYGKEKTLVKLLDGKLTIDMGVLQEFGIQIRHENFHFDEGDEIFPW